MRIRSLGIEIQNIRRVLLVHALVAVLGLSLVVMPACNPATFVQQFDQYTADIVPALNAVLAILQFFGVLAPAGIAAKVDADVKAAQTLVGDFASASTSAQPAVRAQILAAENVLNQDLQSVFVLARVNDKNTQTKVQALIALIESAIQEGFAILPQNTSKAALAGMTGAVNGLKAQQFVPSFNAILTAPTGNKGLDAITPKYKLKTASSLPARFVRVVSFGRL